jgi:lysophospholipase L1-like esterase
VVAPIEPDVVVIYVGWNDLMKFSPRSQAGEGWMARLSQAVDRLWLVRGGRKAAFFYARAAVSDPETGATSRTGRFSGFVPRAFERNLTQLVESVRATGARPLLVTLATPLRPGMSAELIRSRGIFFPFFAGGDRVGDFRDLIAAYNDTIRRVGAEQDVAVADLAHAVERLPDPTPWFWDTMHMNLDGQVLMSDFLLQSLGRSGLLAGSWATASGGSG